MLRIAVSPLGRVEVSAPNDVSDADIIARVRRRASWIARQLSRFDRWRPRTPPRQYESGETHLFLGRPYRLLILQGPMDVALDGSRLVMTLPSDGTRALRQSVLRNWYRRQARRVFPERLDAVLPPFARRGVMRPRLLIREMTRRWGSYTTQGSLVLNLELVRASPSLVGYVIAHELAHALHPHHGPEWNDLLTRILPDWRTRKDQLELELL